MTQSKQRYEPEYRGDMRPEKDVKYTADENDKEYLLNWKTPDELRAEFREIALEPFLQVGYYHRRYSWTMGSAGRVCWAMRFGFRSLGFSDFALFGVPGRKLLKQS